MGLVFFLSVLLGVVAAENTRPPVVLLNGLAGSEIYAKFDRSSARHWFCQKKSKKYLRIWVNTQELAPGVVDCFFENLMIHFDKHTGNYSDTEGMTMDTSYDFGGVKGLEYLDEDISMSGYFHDIISALKKEGYTVGKDLHGAPYDWRLAADGLSTKPLNQAVDGELNRLVEGLPYYDALKLLIERTVQQNNGQRVVIVSHSMGGPVTLGFLNRQTPEWKIKHIAKFVPISPPFGGSLNALQAVVSGDTLGIPVVSHSFLLPIQGSSASGPWLFPKSRLWGDEVLLSTPSRHYTAENYTQMLGDLGNTPALEMVEAGVEKLVLHDFIPPGVPVEVIRGTGVKTPAGFEYPKDFTQGVIPEAPKKTLYEHNGDGTVNDRSLERAAAWALQQNEPVTMTPFANASHFGILFNKDAIKRIVEITKEISQ